MKFAVLPCLVAAVSPVFSVAEEVNPLGKVLQLLDDLATKVKKEGDAEAKAFQEYTDWCDETAQNGEFAVKDASKQKEKLEAAIAKLTSDISVGEEKIADLISSVSLAEKELKNATTIRKKDSEIFTASEAELVSIIDTLERATGILQKEMSKKPGALVQLDNEKSIDGLVGALSSMLDAAAFPSKDIQALTSFVQSRSETDSDEDQAPAAPVYTSSSGGIVEVIEDMKDKAESELAELRKAEKTNKHNFEMLEQSLTDKIKAENEDLASGKTAKGAASEAKATAEGDLQVTTKTLISAKEQLETTRSTCMQVAADHEATLASRTEELKTLADASKVLKETTSGAASESYSLLQVSSQTQNKAEIVRSEVLMAIKKLARQDHSAALAQLASKVQAVLKYGNLGGADPFAKVKGLLTDMIAKLEKEKTAESTEKAYCDEQLSQTKAKKSELEDSSAKMSAKVDKAASKSAQLKEEVAALESELAALAKEQAEAEKIRSETHATYEQAKADLEQGLAGVRKALSVLREYYGSESAALLQDEKQFGSFMQQPAMPEKFKKSTGAGGGVISMLEVIESDFATNLAKEETEESDAQADFETMTQKNKVTKASKDQDVKYKTQESKSLDATISEISTDKDTVSSELSAVNDYLAKLQERCVAKPETYEERKARRDAEIDGLKQALSVLEDETAFVQRKRRSFRGALVPN